MRLRVVIGSLVGLVFAACRPELPPPIQCVESAQCSAGQVCQSNQCVSGGDAGATGLDASTPSDAGDATASTDRDAGPGDGAPTDDATATDGAPPNDAGDGSISDVGLDAGPAVPPVLVTDRFALREEATASLDVLANDQMPAGLTLRQVSQARLGTAVAAANGRSVTFTATVCRPGAGGFTYTAAGNNGLTASATVAVAVVDDTAPGAIPSATVAPSATSDRVVIEVVAPGENGTGSACAVTRYALETGADEALTNATLVSVAAHGTPGTTERLEIALPWGQQHFVQVSAVDDLDQVGGRLSRALRVDLRRSGTLTPAGSSLAFGNVVVDDPETRTWTLRNTSRLVPLRITSSALTDGGAHYSVVTSAVPAGGEVLAPGQSRAFTITYRPTATGAHAASLSIQTDAGNYTIALSGVGVPAVVAAADAFTVEEESTSVFDVLANDTPATGLTIASVTTPAVGTAGVAQAGSRISYAATTCAPATDAFDYTARDTRGRTGVGRANVTIRDTRAPAAIATITPVYVATADRVRMQFVAPGENGAGSTCSPVSYRFRASASAAMTSPTITSLTSPVVPGSQENRDVTLAWGSVHYVQITALDDVSLESAVQPTPLTVDLRGTAALVPAGASATIGPVAIRGAGTRTFQLRNTSPLAGLRVTGASVSGSNAFSITAGAAGTGVGFLAPNGLHDVVVRYAPTAAGPHAATLTISHNGTGSPTTVALTGTTFPNRAPVSVDAFSSPRVVRAGTPVTLTVVVRDDDSNLPSFSDSTVTIDTSAIPGGATGQAMTLASNTSTIVGTYTRNISTTGLSGAYTFPVRIVDSAGVEVWDAVTLAVYTGTAISVTPATAGGIQQAINAAVTGDAVILGPGSYTGGSNTNLVFGSRQIVLASQDGPLTTTIDCGGTVPRAINLANTAQTLATVVAGLRVRGCTGSGAIRFSGAAATLLDLRFEGNTTQDIESDNANAVVHGYRLFFGPSNTTVTSYNYFYCDFCRTDRVATFNATSVRRLSAIASNLQIVGPSNYRRSSDLLIVDPPNYVSVRYADRVEVRQTITVGSQLTSVLMGDVTDVRLSRLRFSTGGSISFSDGPANNVQIDDCVSSATLLYVSASQVTNVLMTNNSARIGLYAGCGFQGVAGVRNLTASRNSWADSTIVFGSPYNCLDTVENAIIDDIGGMADIRVDLPSSNQPRLINTQLPPSPVVVDTRGALNNGNLVSCLAGNFENNFCQVAQFAQGPRGTYYLPASSAAINAGSGSAVDVGLSNYTTSVTGALDTGNVDLGWHYLP